MTFDLMPVNTKSHLCLCLSTNCTIRFTFFYFHPISSCVLLLPPSHFMAEGGFSSHQQNFLSTNACVLYSLFWTFSRRPIPLPLTLGLPLLCNKAFFEHTKGPLLRLLTSEANLGRGRPHAIMEMFFHILL